jgi:pimeloyl-ACP methyl ester carboxylesterase
VPEPIVAGLLLAAVVIAAVVIAGVAARRRSRALRRASRPLAALPLAPAFGPVRFTTNGQVRLAWDEAGNGPPLLLVHGLGYGRWGWEPVAAELARSFRVVRADNRGIGLSDAPLGPYRTRAMAADLVAVLDAAGIDRATVAGISLGGMIAQELALHWPERVERLVLIATVPGGALTSPMPARGAATMAQLPYLREDRREQAAVRLAVSAAGRAARPDLAGRLAELRAAHPQQPGAWSAQASAGVMFDPHGAQRELQVPALVVQGTADQVVDPANGRTLAGLIPGARLEEVPGAGHLLFWERPELFTALVTDFLTPARTGPRRGSRRDG